MNRNIKLTVILCLVFIVLVLYLTYYRITRNNSAGTLSPEALRELGAVMYERPVPLSPFSLVDQYGQPFDGSRLKGGWTLFFFGFTHCPDICPLTLTELSQFYRGLEQSGQYPDTQVVMVSVDPQRDTAEELADYMRSFHPDFIGVNGDFGEVSKLAKELYIAHSTPPGIAAADPHAEHAGHADAASDEDYVIDHSGNILVINPEGLYQGFFDTAIQDDEITAAYKAIRAAY
ncbi:MAG: SCO family protein [Pseudomonadales bacterium]|nr:SCO family protein [Pseudomonadales bacterium]MCP5357795.1 SCO family protein [Pseudomonadales bacterium]